MDGRGPVIKRAGTNFSNACSAGAAAFLLINRSRRQTIVVALQRMMALL